MKFILGGCVSLSGRILAGSNDIDRDKFDFYPTPEWATQSLLEKEEFNGTVWECASGRGDMSKVLEQNGFKVYSSDVRVEDVYGDGGVNFFATKRQVDNVITNPPFNQAQGFVEHAKRNASKKIAMFLKLVFLEGITRHTFFKDKEFPLKKVYVFCKRVNIYKNGIKGNNSSTIAFAWFVWDKEYVGEPVIDWIASDKKNKNKGDELFV
jgi:hypothetical protein